VNFFHPSFKLKQKRREGAEVVQAPATPLRAPLGNPAVNSGCRLTAVEIP
jgi:hypothetical protein